MATRKTRMRRCVSGRTPSTGQASNNHSSTLPRHSRSHLSGWRLDGPLSGISPLLASALLFKECPGNVWGARARANHSKTAGPAICAMHAWRSSYVAGKRRPPYPGPRRVPSSPDRQDTCLLNKELFQIQSKPNDLRSGKPMPGATFCSEAGGRTSRPDLRIAMTRSIHNFTSGARRYQRPPRITQCPA